MEAENLGQELVREQRDYQLAHGGLPGAAIVVARAVTLPVARVDKFGAAG